MVDPAKEEKQTHEEDQAFKVMELSDNESSEEDQADGDLLVM